MFIQLFNQGCLTKCSARRKHSTAVKTNYNKEMNINENKATFNYYELYIIINDIVNMM